jgi:DNA segregation ATPase FtsK/SpoIIIE, S-DNA-T family
VAATQRPSFDIIPTSLRDLSGYAFRCTTPNSSNIHGWAEQGYTGGASCLDCVGRTWI